MSSALSVSPLIAHLLIHRGIESVETAKRFLHPDWSHLNALRGLPDLDRAVERLIQARTRRERVLVFGDYDVDGATGTAQLVAFFRECGFTIKALLPHRIHDGYGLNPESLKKISAAKPDLLITVDNGTNAIQEITALRDQGIEVIVIDHHETPKVIPPVVALLNPKREDSLFREPLASAGLVYLLLVALRGALRDRGETNLPNLRRYLDLACLGTIADIVPLVGLNRLLVKEGLKELSDSQRPGIRALIEKSQIRPPVNVGSVAFRLVPRLNAAGRLADPRLALDLLLAEEVGAADHLAAQLDSLNQERQGIEEQVFQEAVSIIDREQKDRRAIVVGQEGWHLGVVGIVAARLVEKYRKPAVVLSIDKGIAKGSARTVPGFPLYDCLNRLRENFIRFGGHQAAAGMTLARENMGPLLQQFDEAVGTYPAPSTTTIVDSVLSLGDITPLLVNELALLSPHGPGNPQPVFAAEGISFQKSRLVGERHLKTEVHQHGIALSAIAFDQGDSLATVSQGKPMTVTFSPEWNLWNGMESIQLVIKKIYNS